MTTPWLHIVGIGEVGMDGLTLVTLAVVEAAEVIAGGDRHHTLSLNPEAQRIAWLSPIDAMIETLASLKGKRAVVRVLIGIIFYSSHFYKSLTGH